MKKRFFHLFLAALMLTACAGVRYSPSELKAFSPEAQQRIKKAEVALDMTPLEVRYSWGAPTDVNVLAQTEDGKYRERWVYREWVFFTTTLIFTDGRLAEIISTDPKVKKSVTEVKKGGQ